MREDGRSDVYLTQSAFYPTSGGQPHDIGTLSGLDVVDVVIDGSTVVHVVDGVLAVGDKVVGHIDWARRFDHMQQHCGQHILSAAFEHLFGWHTVSFHLSENSVTIDIEAEEYDEAQVERAEALANRIVFEDRPISSRFVDREELSSIPLWKPSKVEENIRIVTIEDFDYNACGGTHPSSTGQVGMIKVTKVEKVRQGLRLSFLCGTRALQDYGTRVDVLTNVGNRLSAGLNEVVTAVTNLQTSFNESKRRFERLNAEYYALRAKFIWQEETARSPSLRKLVYRETETSDVASLKLLMQGLESEMAAADKDGTVCVLGEVDGRIHIFVKCLGANAADELLKPILQQSSGKGGGNQRAAQGSAPVDMEHPTEWFEAGLRAALAD